MKRIFLLVLMLNIISCATFRRVKVLTIKDAFVYEYFTKKGYLYTEAIGVFQKFENCDSTKIKMKSIQIDSLNILLRNSKNKCHYKGKFPPNILFAQFINSEGKISKIVISKTVICDLTNDIEYRIIEETQRKWLSYFCENVRK
jgi:hypothetical protein